MRALPLVLILCLTPASGFAHGGEKHSHEAIEESPVLSNEMVVGEPSPEPVDYGTEDTPVDYGSAEIIPQDEPPSLGTGESVLDLHKAPMGMEHSGDMKSSMQHTGHKMAEQKVELAEHTWVPSSQKGYGIAIGITVLSGLAFGFLALVRPLE